MRIRPLSSLWLPALAVLGASGCGSSETTVPATPTTDNRPSEVKEADDMMLKYAPKNMVKKGAAKR